jgi:hypothetical protein
LFAQAPSPPPSMRPRTHLTLRQGIRVISKSSRGVCHVVDGDYRKGRAVATSSGDANSFAPGGEGRCPELPMRAGGDEMTAGIEGIVDGGVNRQEALG